MSIFPLLLPVLLLAPLGLPARPPSPAARTASPAVLRAYEYVPPPARLSPRTVRALRASLSDPQEDPVVRARALLMLSRDDDPVARKQTQAWLADPHASGPTDPFLRRKAIVALALQRHEAALPDIERLYRAPSTDAKLRHACAQALHAVGPAAVPLQRRLLAIETDTEIRALLRPEMEPRR